MIPSARVAEVVLAVASWAAAADDVRTKAGVVEGAAEPDAARAGDLFLGYATWKCTST